MTMEPGHPPANRDLPVTLPSGSFDPAMTPALFRAVFPSVMLPMFMAVGDQTIVSSALPAIAASLGDVERVSWAVVAYLVAATIAAPLYGYLADRFGRRRLMFVALAVFMAGSLICALSPSALWLAGARMLQGFGGGGLMALSQALIGEVVPPRQRGHYQGYLATVATASAALGPVLGGFMTEHFGWRAIFFVNGPLGLLAFLLVLRLPAKPGVRQEGWSFDAPGLAYFIAFIVPMLIALERARHFENGFPFSALALLAVSVIALVFLLRQESRASAPLLPLTLFRQPAIWRANGMAFCTGASLTSLIAFLPLYLRVTHGTTPSQVGMILLPVTIAIGVGSILTGRLVTRTGMTMVFPSWGLILATAAMLTFAAGGERMSVMQILVTLSIGAFFMGTVMSIVQVTVQSAAGRKALGAAAGSVQFSRTVGAAFGVALLNSALFASLAFADPETLGIFGRVVDLGPAALEALEPARRAAVEADISAAFRAAFLFIGVFTAAGVVLAFTNPLRRV